MIAALTAGLSILAILLEMIVRFRQSPQHVQGETYDDIQTGRQAIASGDTDAVNVRVDSLRAVPKTGGDITGELDTGDLLRRTHAVTGADILPDRAGSTGETPGIR